MTSITLEEEFFKTLKEIAQKKKKSINDLVTEIDATRKKSNLSSAVRVYILEEIKKQF